MAESIQSEVLKTKAIGSMYLKWLNFSNLFPPIENRFFFENILVSRYERFFECKLRLRDAPIRGRSITAFTVVYFLADHEYALTCGLFEETYKVRKKTFK